MTLGIYIHHSQFDDPDVTLRTVAAVQADANGWGKLYVICNGKSTPQLPFIKGVATIRHFNAATDVAVMQRAIRDYPTDVNVLLRSGVEVQRGTLARLVTALSDDSIGIVAPTTYRIDESMMGTEGLSDTKFVRDWCWAWRSELTEVIGYPDWVHNAFRECPGNDVDFCYRAREHGYRVVQDNEALAMLPDAIDERWSNKARTWLITKHGLLKINEVW